MCGGPEQAHAHPPHVETESSFNVKMGTTVMKKSDHEEFLYSSSYLLELAANDDLNRFARCTKEQNAKVDEPGMWYVRHSGTSHMVLEQRTPIMVAALYGSVRVLTYILNHTAMYGGDINQACGRDGSTAMHCAAAGGSMHALQVVKHLLNAGANTSVCDTRGRRPVDVLAVSFSNINNKFALEELLNSGKRVGTPAEHGLSMPLSLESVGLSSYVKSFSSASALSSASGASSLSMSLSASSSPKSPHIGLARGLVEDGEIARDFSLDNLIPDIKNTFYSSDEFRMYSFKIRPCSRAYSHDWTECPFAHPGENARRRDPRKHHYSCVPCPDFRKGACNHGDACEYAHGVFECWLHPAQYRTRLCKDGVDCSRKVCFFAHRHEELRPVYESTGSGLPSPMSAVFTDMSCLSPPPHAPSSPSAMPLYSPLHPLQSSVQCSVRTPPISPASSGWQQATVPTLHLPGSTLHSSRLRSAFSARDDSASSFTDEQLINEFQSLAAHQVSTQARLNAAVAASGNASSRSGRYKSLGLTVAPANLEELFASESMPSPGLSLREANWLGQFEYRPPQKQLHGPILQSTRDSSPFLKLGSVSSGMDPSMSKGVVSPALVAARAALSKGSRSFRELPAGKDLWSEWGSPTGKLEWGVQEEDLSKLRKSASVRMRSSIEQGLEPDLSWVQKLVKEGSVENEVGVDADGYHESGQGTVQREGADMMASWIDSLCVDQIAA